MLRRSLVLSAAFLSACASGVDGSADSADITVSVHAAKVALKRVTARGDSSLQINQKPKFEQPMTVVLKLAGDPVAVVRGKSGNKQIAVADKANIESTLAAQQSALRASIEANGGTVLAQFQNALNGVKVTAPAGKIAALATLPGVIEVKRVATHKRLNSISVPFIGAPAVWNGTPGFRGENIKVAIIDTGIDYTHANFGGPGTPDAYNAAFKTDTLPADPKMFGPDAPKVKGGTDLAGDDYDPSDPTKPPVPDSNPLDCGAHGSHVAGTVAGFGVLADGTTYTGSYDASTPSQKWAIGPGVAPMADLYAVRVFGCNGSTNLVVDALDWAVKNNMDVVNMSLGSPFGAEDDADAEASENAAEAGIIVVAAAGNEGPGNYITGSPAAGDKVISVAAIDSNDPPSYPGISVVLGAASIVAQNSNNAAFNSTGLAVFALPDGKGGVSLGCNESEYVDAQIAGKLVVTQRGTCPRINRAQFGFKHGAAAVALINNGAGYSYFEGDIATADGKGVVTIPFLSVLKSDGPSLAAAANASLDSRLDIPNPLFRAFADFSSGGPRGADGRLKPDVSAPGVNITSTMMGSGNQGVAFSGTSMATPHVAGVAALALQAHPYWSPAAVRTAILNTADASQVVGYQVRMGGSGLVQPFPASRTSAIAVDEDTGAANLSFGVQEFTNDYSRTKTIRVINYSGKDLRFAVSAVSAAGSPSKVDIEPSVLWVNAGSSALAYVTLSVPAATTGDSGDFREVSGLIQLTPSKGWNGDAALTVPYYLVPRARSKVRTKLPASFGPKSPAAVAKVRNEGNVAGTADFYAWGLAGTNTKAGEVGLRAVGVQANPVGGDQLLFFAINTFKRWSNNSGNEFDVLIDTVGDGKPHYAVIATDLGYLTTGTPVGQMITAVLNVDNPQASPGIQYPVAAPTDGSAMLIPVFAADIGVTAAAPRFAYSVQSFSTTGATDVATGWAKFNAFHSAVTTAAYVPLNPGEHASVPLAIDPVEWAQSPALGVMVIGLENFNGGQARLLGIGRASDPE
jgi:minor extracellular serine protease Vpr